MKVRYIRLLSYDNACNVINFILTLGGKNYANITVGGVSTQVDDDKWDKVVEYLETLDSRYEVGDEAPYKVEANIVANLKRKGIVRQILYGI